MEVRARYTLMGLFAVAVIFFVFAFVYWLDAAGGIGKRSTYLVRFDGPVSGLLRGSAVLFNGVRVGEVSSLKLDAARPQEVQVEIVIDQATPVRRDTKVDIDFQGLTGAPVVALVGGSGALPLLRGAAGEKPLLIAEKGAGEGMTQVARQVLKRLDGVIAENSKPLRDTIASIDTFAGALARNSDKVDGIFAGLERLTGGGKKKSSDVFDLLPAKIDPKPAKVPSGQLLIADPTALAVLDAERVRVSGPDADKLGLASARWPDILSKLLVTRIIQSFESAGYTGAVARTLDEVKTNYRLLTNVREFAIKTGPDAAAVVEIAAKLVDPEGRVVAARTFQASRPLVKLDAASAMQTLNESSQTVLGELVLWVCKTI
jgi:phospholipid/cholesterol/gamma-HCH transport system substrate-binding protein